MSTITNVRNGRNFPDFTSIPDDNEIDLDYYSEINDFHFTPSRHWCLLAEITHVGYDFRLRLAVRDRSDTEFGIHFHLDNDTGLDLSRFKRGHTVAILDPLRHGFLDFSYGIRQEDLSSIRVIPLSMRELLALNDRVQIQAQARLLGGERACHACGTGGTTLKCTRCGLFWYCNKTCQERGWLEKGHKQDCKALKDIKGFFTNDWETFRRFLKFPRKS